MRKNPALWFFLSSLVVVLFLALYPAKIDTTGPSLSIADAQTAAELSALDTLLRGFVSAYQNAPPLQAVATAATQKTCVGFWNNATSPRCWVRQLFAVTGAFLMWLGIKLVVLAGATFEYVLQHGVVQFGETLKYLMNGIEVGWEAMRDIANIVIIGMFVFIAINLILGVKDFGDKKKIARVLIVAVLINFSLLFSKGIIDASNFVAYQFYKSMVAQYDAREVGTNVAGTQGSLQPLEGSTGAVENTSISGIAGRFLNMLGIKGVADSYNNIRAVQESQNDDLIGLGYGLLMLVFLGATALVFFYGTYLLITRAILLIFVMLTSAAAFAAWLIPHQFIEEGWLKWWKTLLKGAFLAPILMAFLWATYNISTALVTRQTSTGQQLGSLGDLAANASTEGNIAVLFTFLIILGLLFVSFKASSELAGSISGFGAIGTGLRNLAVGLPALAWRFGAAPLARQTIGRFAYEQRDQWIGKGRIANDKAGAAERAAARFDEAGDFARAELKRRDAAKYHKEAAYYAKLQDKASKLAGAGFNLGDVGLVKQVAKAAGISGLIAGERGKNVPVGYQQAIEARIDKAEKAFKPLEVSPSQREKIMQDTRKDIMEGKVDEAKPYLERRRNAQTAHDEARAEKEALEKSPEMMELKEQAKRIKAGIERDRDRELKDLKAEFARAGTETERQAKLGEIGARTAHWQKQLADHEKDTNALLEPLTSANKRLEEAGDNLKQASTDLNKFVGEEGRRRVRDRRVGSVGAAQYFGQKKAGYFYTATGQSEHIGKELASKVRSRIGQEGRLSQMLQRIPDEITAHADEAEE